MSVPFTVTAVYSDGFDITFTNTTAAGTLVFLELNRAQDFASDDTLLIALVAENSGAANSVTIRGLPNDTPFFLRMYNPAAGGAYSEVQHWATASSSGNATFTGYSIEPSMIVVPADIRIFSTYISPGTTIMQSHPASNLLLPDPQSTFQMQSNGNMGLSVTFVTSGEPIDTFALLGTMAGPSMNIALNAYTDGSYSAVTFAANPQTMRASPDVGRRQSYHSLVRLNQPRTERHWAFFVSGPARHFLARNFVVGLARQSTNASKGHGETSADLGTAARNRFGVTDGVPGWRARTVDFEMSWLREAEYHAKYADLFGLVGSTKPVLALVNPKRNLFLQDRIAFGPMTALRAETPASRRNSLNVEVNSLY